MMTSENILTACEAKGLRPACDNPSYADGRCRITQQENFHLVSA
jgi:hypothetical protein